MIQTFRSINKEKKYKEKFFTLNVTTIMGLVVF